MQPKVLIVTGAAGIGAATIRLAAAGGARVVIATADEVAGFELAAETGAECWAGDLTLPHAASGVLAHCLSRFGRVDGLFNVAGLSGRRYGDGPVHEIQDEAWHTTLSHNLTVAFRMCREIAGRMLEQPPDDMGARGAIVNMGSVLVESPEPRHFPTHAYAAAKGAITALSKSMAAYYAPHGIRVNVIAPGLVRTPAGERTSLDPEFQDFVRKKQSLKNGMIEIADVARAALFLLGDESRSMTGEVLTIDGGWRLSSV
jgi:NAD(P)-dependent dehydrogenase (short-subunit alcohol dehydrogenase family)